MKKYYCFGKKDFCDRDYVKDCGDCEHFDGNGGEEREDEDIQIFTEEKMSKEKQIDCLHYDDELGCCMLLSDWSQPMPTLQSCVESPCEHYVKGCYYCIAGDEKCATCVKFFDYFEDGTGERCSVGFDRKKCVRYTPIKYCPMCGKEMKGTRDEQRKAD